MTILKKKKISEVTNKKPYNPFEQKFITSFVIKLINLDLLFSVCQL